MTKRQHRKKSKLTPETKNQESSLSQPPNLHHQESKRNRRKSNAHNNTSPSPSKYFHRKASSSSLENAEDPILEMYRELQIRLSSFRTYPQINGLFPVALRLAIFFLSCFLFQSLLRNFYQKLSASIATEVLPFKSRSIVLKFFIKFVTASYKHDRGLLMTGLFSLLPVLIVVYCFLVASLGSLYIYLSGSAEEVEREIWENTLANLHRYGTRHSKKVPFWLKRLYGCSSRLDCVLGYSATLPLLHFLNSFHFKLIPIPNAWPILGILILPLLIVLDEFLIIKQKIELEALFKLFRFHAFILLAGTAWIFHIRYIIIVLVVLLFIYTYLIHLDSYTPKWIQPFL